MWARRQPKFPTAQALLAVEESGRRHREDEPPFRVGLFWTEIRLHCSASIAAAVGTGAARGLRARRINTSKRFTVAAEFIKKGSGMCEDQHCVVFLNVWSALFDEL